MFMYVVCVSLRTSMYVHMIVLRAIMYNVHVCCVCTFVYVYVCMYVHIIILLQFSCMLCVHVHVCLCMYVHICLYLSCYYLTNHLIIYLSIDVRIYACIC
jgi:hypothetical protein